MDCVFGLCIPGDYHVLLSCKDMHVQWLQRNSFLKCLLKKFFYSGLFKTIPWFSVWRLNVSKSQMFIVYILSTILCACWGWGLSGEKRYQFTIFSKFKPEEEPRNLPRAWILCSFISFIIRLYPLLNNFLHKKLVKMQGAWVAQ